MHATQRLATNEAVQGFQAERELPQREPPLGAEAPFPQSLQLAGEGVLRPVDEPEILGATNLQRRLNETFGAASDKCTGFTTTPSPH